MSAEIVPIEIEDLVSIPNQFAQSVGSGFERVKQVLIVESYHPPGEWRGECHVLVGRRKVWESEGLLNSPVDFLRHSVQLITQPVIQSQPSAGAPVVVGE